MAPIAVIGGGISGLSAAYYLRKRGLPSVLIDPSPVLGGLLRTEQVDGCTIETGADSWLAQKPWARQLATELGLASDIIGSNDAVRKILVLRRGKLVPFPPGMQLVVPRRLRTVWTAPLFSLTTKLRMTANWFRLVQGPRPDRSVAAFVRDHFGQGAVDYLAEPLLTGIYGGDPELLSAASVLPKLVAREARQGSLIRGAYAEPLPAGPVFESMRGGLGQLCHALTPGERITGKVEAIERTGDGWRVRVSSDWIPASAVILATAAHQAAKLAGGELGAALASISHSSAHIVAMGFRGMPPLPGFGFLVPKAEGHNLMAATFVSTKFAHRVPPGLQLVRAFFRQPPVDPVGELRAVTAIAMQPEFVRTYSWPNSLPQYAVGHQALVNRIDSLALRSPGLHLIGNAYQGVGIPDCIRLAKEVVAEIDLSSADDFQPETCP